MRHDCGRRGAKRGALGDSLRTTRSAVTVSLRRAHPAAASVIVDAASTPSATPPSGGRATHGGRADLWLTAVVPAGTHVRLSV